MTDTPMCTVGELLAGRLRAASNQIASRWLERITARVSLTADAIFPSDELLDHVPLLIEGVAAYLEGSATGIDDDVPVVAKARELGAMRHAQGFDVYQILKEHQLLGSIILAFLEEVVDDIDVPCSRRELVSCFRRAEEAIEIVRQATTNHFLQLAATRVRE